MNASVVNLQNATALNSNPNAKPSKELGKEDFMKLLLTQLSSQDPMNPQDSSAFVAQLSQFAQVEGIMNMGQKMDELVKIGSANNSSTSVSLLGKEVRVEGNKLSGAGSAFYELSGDALSARLEVLDANGKVVKAVDSLSTAKGMHEVALSDLAAGTYTFRIVASDAYGRPVTSKLSATEKIKGVNFTDGTPKLITESGRELTAAQVSEIRQPVSF